MIALVVPIGLEEEKRGYFEELMRKTADNGSVFLIYGPQFYLMRYSKSAYSLSEALGLGGGIDRRNGLVFEFNSNFAGFCSQHLQDWVNEKP